MSLFNIKKITVGPETLVATIVLDEAAPVMTSDDIEGTKRVYDLMPQIAEHSCVCEQGDVFRDALPSTQTAHLLEHVAVELLTRLDVEDVSAGNTAPVEGAERTWTVKLSCSNDVMVCGAISSAAWLLDVVFGRENVALDVDHIVEGLRDLTKGLPIPSQP